MSYPSPTLLITVPNDAIRRKIKRRDFQHEVLLDILLLVLFLIFSLQAYGTTIDNKVKCMLASKAKSAKRVSI